METLIIILLSVLIAYFGGSALYLFVLALASKVKTRSSFQSVEKRNKFLVMVPAYKEDAVIIESTKRNMALRYQYPKRAFDYVVIADGLKLETVKTLRNLGADVLEVKFEKSTKVKSLQEAMRVYGENKTYDATVILDADNVMDMNFLTKSNQYINRGMKAIQGNRAAANGQNTIALLDGLSEFANQEMICKGANVLGLSSKLSGSAMVFDFELLKSVVFDLTAIGGFDKELELAFTAKKVFIHFSEDLVIKDEKVGSFQHFSKQRGRWLESQYTFLRKSIKPAFKALLKGNFDYFHKTMQLALPPRALAPFVMLMLVVLSLLTGNVVLITLATMGTVANFGAYVVCLPFKVLLKNGLKLVVALPKLVLSTLNAFTWMKKSRTEFIHTPHNAV